MFENESQVLAPYPRGTLFDWSLVKLSMVSPEDAV